MNPASERRNVFYSFGNLLLSLKPKWLDKALIISSIAKATFVIAGFAAIRGHFMTSVTGFSLSFLLLSGKAFYHHKVVQWYPIEMPPLPLPPMQSLEIRDYEQNYFSPPYREVDTHLQLHLDHSIREGYSETDASDFSINLLAVSAQYIDQTINDPWVGVAHTKNAKHRHMMEDVHFVQETCFGKVVVVCDGHGDKATAGKYLKEHFVKELNKIVVSSTPERDITDTLTKLMVKLNQEIGNLPTINHQSGCTFLAALIFNDQIYIVNVGDSRAILCKKKCFYQLSEDASLKNNRFVEEVKKNGQFLFENKGEMRVEGVYNLTHDLGDTRLSPQPGITRIFRGNGKDNLANMTLFCPNGSYLILASDGLWGFASNQKVYNAIAQMNQKGMPPREMAAYLVDGALRNGSNDNVTVSVVKIHDRDHRTI